MILEKKRKKFDYIDSLVQTVQTFSEDTKMEFEIKKYGVTTLERKKVVTTEGIQQAEKWWKKLMMDDVNT